MEGEPPWQPAAGRLETVCGLAGDEGRDVVPQVLADRLGPAVPVHLDEDYARTTRFKGRIVHGMLSASFLSTTIASRLPGPGTILAPDAACVPG